MKRIRNLLFCSMLVLGLVSCSEKKAPATTEVKYKDVLSIAYNAQPSTFDPMVTGATATAEVCRLVFESLFEMDEHGDPRPQLCESYSKSDDNTQWTFKLRKGVIFHNGEEMKAKDVAASMNRWVSQNTIIQRAIKNGEKFVADDEYTVSIKIDSPTLMLPNMIAQFSQFAAILPASVIESIGSGTLQPKDLIGTGSFKFIEWAVDSYIKLEAFDGYKPCTTERSGSYGDRTTGVKTVMIYFVTDPQTRLTGLETGEYDIAVNINYTDVPRLKTMRGVKMMSETFNVLTVTMNKDLNGDSIMKDEKWRQVIGYAINLDEIMEGAIPSVGDYKAYYADAGYFGKDSPWHSGAKSAVTYNPEKAKALLKELGYDGSPLRMMTTEAYTEFYNATLVMKQQLEAVGFKVQFDVYDWGTMLTKLGSTKGWDLYPMNYPFANNPCSNMTLMKTNASGFTNDPKLNSLMSELQALPDTDKAKAFWNTTIEPYCEEAMFIINLGGYDFVYGVSDKVEGFKPFYGLDIWGTKVAQ